MTASKVTKPFRWKGRMLAVGDSFDVPDRYKKLLTRSKRIELVSATPRSRPAAVARVATPTIEVVADAPEECAATEHERTTDAKLRSRKATYKRRDMRAE